jgi:hypothetical protein
MREPTRKAFEASRLMPVKLEWTFGALGDGQLRSAGSAKLLADDRIVGERNISQDWLDCEVAARADRFGDVDQLSVLNRRWSVLVGKRLAALSALWLGERPNQSPEPTALLVTPRAGARVAPSNAVAHL